MREYLQNVLTGKFRYNHAIIHNYQVYFILFISLLILGHFQFVAKLES